MTLLTLLIEARYSKISFNQRVPDVLQKHHGREAVITTVFFQMAHDLVCLSTNYIHLIELVSTGPLHQKIPLFSFVLYIICILWGF